MVVAVVGDVGACFCCARLLVGCLLLFWFNAVGLLLLFLVRVCWFGLFTPFCCLWFVLSVSVGCCFPFFFWCWFVGFAVVVRN